MQENISQTIAALRVHQEQYEMRMKDRIDHIDERIATAQDRAKDRASSIAEAVKVALEANEKRLDGMNEFREAMSDQANKMMSRVEAQAIISQHHEQLLGEIKPLQQQIEESRRPNYGLWAASGSVLAGAVAACWVIIGLKVNEVNTPLDNAVAQLTVTLHLHSSDLDSLKADMIKNRELDGVSTVDRAQLNTRLQTVEQEFSTKITQKNAQLADLHSNIVELRTLTENQIILREQITDELRRWIQTIWEKQNPGQRFPK